MSIAERTLRRLGRRAGYTFLEMTIVLGIVSGMSLVVQRVLTSTQDTDRYLAAVRLATERGQKIAYDVRHIVGTSRKLFQNDATGQGYLAALNLTRDPQATGVRLPLFDEVSPLGPDDPNDPHTGNCLLFVREADSAPCVADASTAKIRSIDTYRFVCIYPRVAARTLIPGQGAAWDLVIWRSVPFPSRQQILGISTSTEKTSVIKDLYNRFGYTYAWDPSGTASTSFYGIDNLGNISSTATATVSIGEDTTVSARGRLAYANVQLATTDSTSYVRKGLFTNATDAWSPHGFEVKVAGASGSRKVWIHIVVETPAGQKVAVMGSTMIASTKDL